MLPRMIPIVEISGLAKSFGGTRALDGVSLAFQIGEIHALMGENGAGKSTLGKILAGIHSPDAGQVLIDGHPVHFSSPRDARRSGIGMVHQEVACCPDLSVAENLAMGRLPRTAEILVDRRAMIDNAKALLGNIQAAIDVTIPMRELSVAHHQLVQIAGAVGSGARLLILDEPTSSLSQADAERLFTLARQLRDRGVTIIYVSHRMEEVFGLCDRISVLRDGRLVGTVAGPGASQDAIVEMMIGRQIQESAPPPPATPSETPLLRIDDFSSPGKFAHIALTLGAGEIVGLAGLVGSGRTELATALFGLDPSATGRIELDGKDIAHASVRGRMRAGIGFVPEDRARFGLALNLSCRFNFSLTLLPMLHRIGFLRGKLETSLLRKHFGALGVKTQSYESEAGSLSGGNQQKIVLAKWLARSPRVLLLDEPTRGVDIGAKTAIHDLCTSLAAQGIGILLISSELPELLKLSSRICVMREGALVGEVPRKDATQDLLLRMMSGLAVSPGSPSRSEQQGSTHTMENS
jgi:ABC-type sugar transport system ATPase subunit